MSEVPTWTLKEIWLFDKTMTHGSLTAAAFDLNMTQSAASRILASLEAKLGMTLFDRIGRNLMPNEAAFRFHGKARAIILAAVDAPDTAEETLPLTVAVPPSYASGFIQDATALFLRETPGARISIEVRSTPVIEELIAEGKIDIGLTDGRILSQAVRTQQFRSSGLCCFLAQTHPLAARKSISVADLTDSSVILFTRRHDVRNHISALMQKSGVAIDTRIETSTGISALWHAKFQSGITIMNAFPLREYLPPGLTTVAFDPSITYKTAFVLPAWRGTTATVRGFMRAVRKTSEKQAEWSTVIL